MGHPINNLDELFESVLLKEDDINHIISDDTEDNLLGYLEENRKISIFDSDYILEGEE